MQKLMAMREPKRARTDAKGVGESLNIVASAQERGNCYVARGRTVHVTGRAFDGTALSLVPDDRHLERLHPNLMRHKLNASQLFMQALLSRTITSRSL